MTHEDAQQLIAAVHSLGDWATVIFGALAALWGSGVILLVRIAVAIERNGAKGAE